MFVVRGEGGLIFTSCEQGENYGKELMYETREKAEKERESMQLSFKDRDLYVEEVKVGRPPIGVTRKVSVTLPEDDWEWLDKQGKRSETFRKIVYDVRNPYVSSTEWSNNACLGYAIMGAQKLGYDDEATQKLVRAIYSQFDFKSIEDAKKVYNDSPF